MSEVQRSTIAYPGGITARYRWAGSGAGGEVFALSVARGPVRDLETIAGGDPDRLCRAELRIEGPLGEWTARLASPIFDAPTGWLWDDAAQLVVKYGFVAYGFASRSGELGWSHASGTPLLAVLGSTRLPHVLLQSEIETVALDPLGRVRWRAAHSDVITAAELVGGRLTLASYGGGISVLDPSTGRALEG